MSPEQLAKIIKDDKVQLTEAQKDRLLYLFEELEERQIACAKIKVTVENDTPTIHVSFTLS
ncbi:MAG: hypothetical protein ABI378_05910 [Chitinophagaceae bacterium]